MPPHTLKKTRRTWFDHLRRLVLILVGVTLPFEYTSLGEFLVQLTPNKIVTLTLMVFVVVQFVVEQRPLAPDRKRLWVVFFGVAVTISAIPSFLQPNIPSDAVRRELVTCYAIILFYFAMQLALKDRSDIDVVFRSFAVGCVLAVVTGFLGYGIQIENREYTRIGGEGGGPNLLAFNILVVVAATASFYFSSRSRMARLFYVGTIGALTLGLISTLSRSGYIAFVAMGGLFAVRSGKVGIVKYVLPALLLLALALLLAPEAAYQRTATLTPEGIMSEDSARGRLEMFPDVAKALMSNPITGVGLRGFIRWAYEHDMEASGIHSAFLRVLAENGLLGFVPFVAIAILTWTALTRAWRLALRYRVRRDPELETLYLRAVLLQVGYFGALVMSQAQPAAYHKSLWLVFAVAPLVHHLVRQRVAELEADSKVEESEPATFAPPMLEPGFGVEPR